MEPRTDRLFDRVAWLMDRSFRIPGTRMTVGLDALLELVPGLGDAAATLIQGALVLAIALRNPGLPRSLVARMVANIALDCLVGTIPLVGDVFDAYFKANTRNVALLRQARAQQLRGERVRAGAHVAYLVALALVLLLVAGGVAAAAVYVVNAVATASSPTIAWPSLR